MILTLNDIQVNILIIILFYKDKKTNSQIDRKITLGDIILDFKILYRGSLILKCHVYLKTKI